MRSRIRNTGLTCRLCGVGLVVILMGSSFAQTPRQAPDEQPAEDVEAEKPSPQDQSDEMRRLMGERYTPRELYPSLMQLPDLSPEQRAEITRLARQRMEDGLRMVSQSRAALGDHGRTGSRRGGPVRSLWRSR